MTSLIDLYKTNGSRKRHCMVVHAYYPLGETRVEREAQALLQHGYEVDVICLREDGEPSFEEVDGIKVYRLPVKRRKGRGKFAQLLEYLAFFCLTFYKLFILQFKRVYRVVQVHNLPDFLVFATIWPKLSGAKIILDLHDLMPEFFATTFERSMESWPVHLLIWQERISCRFADHVITVTDFWRETIIRRGIPPEKVSVVMNVADNQVFLRIPATKPVRRNNGRFNLIYHGTLTQRYGVDLIIQAVEIVRQKIPEIYLTIHGQGEYLKELETLVKKVDLENHICFSTRLLPVSELPKFIMQADVGIVPNRRSLFTDAILPTKLLEYVALGIPVIAAYTPAIANYFDDTMVEFFEPGNVTSLADSILRLYSDDSRLNQLADNSKKFNELYNWTQIAACYVALVDRLEGKRGME